MARRVGVTANAYQRYEEDDQSKRAYPKYQTLVQISEEVGLPLDYLVKGEEPRPPDGADYSEGALTVARYYDQMTPDRRERLLLFAIAMRDASVS